MREITIQLTENQEKFLKLFANKHSPNAHDNLCTTHPIHVVQSYKPRYIPYGRDTEEFMDGDDLRFCWDDDRSIWIKGDVEAVQAWYDYDSETCPIPIKPYSEVEDTDMVNVAGDEVRISDYDDYFKAYGFEWVDMAWEQEEWQDIAYFFILEEAKKYMDYQRHNLKSPRTYTYSGGYSNCGEYNHFWELLFDLGNKLNKDVN